MANGGDRNLAKVRRTLLDVAVAGANLGQDGKFDESDLAILSSQVANVPEPELPDYSRYDLNGDGFTGGGGVARFDLDLNELPAWTMVTQNIKGGSVAFNEKEITDLDVVCYYAYSNLYEGSSVYRDNLLVGCREVSVQISPASATIPAGGTVQFSAVVKNALDTSVVWSRTDGSFGSTDASTVLYTAPMIPGTYTITATSTADITKTASATVTVTAITGIQISPTASTVGVGGTLRFTISPPGTAVIWSWTGGGNVLDGLYTAPTVPGNYTVTATIVGGTATAMANITVLPLSVSIIYRGSTLAAEILGAPVSSALLSSAPGDYGRYSPDPTLTSFSRACGAAAASLHDSNLVTIANNLTGIAGVLNVRSASGSATSGTSPCLGTETTSNIFQVEFRTNTTVRFNLAGSITYARTPDVGFSLLGGNWFTVSLEEIFGFPLLTMAPTSGLPATATTPLDQSIVLGPGDYRFRVDMNTKTAHTSLSAISSDISIGAVFTVDLTAP